MESQDLPWQGSSVRALVCRSYAPLARLAVGDFPDPVRIGLATVDLAEAIGADAVSSAPSGGRAGTW